MPSSHVANNAAFAFMAGAIFGWRGRLVWIAVFLIAYSRIYIGSHFPSDVVAALLLALGYSSTLAWAAQRLWRFSGPRCMATVYDTHPNLFPNPAVPAPVNRVAAKA
jgi:undecaprenyl-diphosphatase